MTINYTPLLSLAEPVSGTQSGSWGNDINQGLTDYLDIAVAGAQVISGSQTAVTLSKTTGSAAATNIAQVGSAGTTGTAQYAVINCTGNPASMLTITAPATSKTYVVINSTSTNQPVKLVGVGPTTGVTVAAGQAALIAWKGTDFTLVATTDVSKLTGVLGTGNGGTGQSTYVDGQLLIGNSTGNTLTKALLSTGTGISVTNGPGAITITNTAPDQVVSLTGAGATTTSGTYPNFTISSVNTTYGTATSTVPGLIELGSDTPQTTAANAVTSDASRTYALQLNASGQAVVNVPWTDTSSTPPGGSTTQVQYNNAGAFGGSANFTFDGTTVTTANDASISGLTVGKGAGSLDSNTAVGNGAFSSNTTGLSNTAVGRLTLQLNLVGDNITAVGRGAAQHAKGSANTALGAYALQGNFAAATGIANIAVGTFSLNNFTTATNNIAIGDSAMYGVSTATNSIGIGPSALSTTSGNKNVAIGYESGNAITTGSNNVVIGGYTGSTAPIFATGSNFIVLSDGAGNVRAYWNAANATFNGDLNTTGTITQNSVAVVTTTGTQTLTNKTLSSPSLLNPSMLNPALGTPSSGTLTNCGFLPINAGTTGTLPISRGGTGTTLSTGSGALVLMDSPTINGPALTNAALGTPVSGNFSTGTFTWPTFNQSTSGNALTATTATNIAAGTAGRVPYQTGVGTTGFSDAAIAGYVLQSSGSSSPPTWRQVSSSNAASSIVARDGSNGFDAATQTAGDNTTKVATTAFVQTAIGSTGATGTRGQVFTANGTFTIPTGVTALKITVVGGGGGGSAGSGTCGSFVSGQGGGGGGTAQSFLTSLTPGNTLSVTIGSAGSIGNSGGNSTVTSGTQTISTITGGGGSGGSAGGAGGTASGGTLNSGGGAGDSFDVSISTVYGGPGGSSMYGGGGSGSASGAATAGRLYGGGGGAGSSSTNGAAGAAGVVIFEW